MISTLNSAVKLRPSPTLPSLHWAAMTAIVTPTVAALLDAFKVPRHRFRTIGALDIAAEVLCLPNDTEIIKMLSSAVFWSPSGQRVEAKVEDVHPSRLHKYDFVCLEPSDEGKVSLKVLSRAIVH
jgi:hypothetical protein